MGTMSPLHWLVVLVVVLLVFGPKRLGDVGKGLGQGLRGLREGLAGRDPDAPPPAGNGNRIGLLGADYEIANGKYRFKKIYRSTTYSSPNGSFGAPLDQPGIDVREGDYLLNVNDQVVDAAKNILSYFENTGGRPTKITVSATADGANARTYTVFPALGENRLRRANWAEANRKRVEELSGGRLGYIYIEGYGREGLMNAVRGLTGYADKQGTC